MSKGPVKLPSRTRAIRDETVWLRLFRARTLHSLAGLRLAIIRSQRITQAKRRAG